MTFQLEIERTQHAHVEVDAESLDQAIAVVQGADFPVPPADEWGTGDSWTVLVPLNDAGDYDENGYYQELN